MGGNTLILAMLRDFAEELDATAPLEALDATIAATREQFMSRTASLAISEPQTSEGKLRFDITVQNLTGHKLPTGHAPAGAALGQDTVIYSVPVGGTAPYQIKARLLYQSSSPRWADELTAYDTPAIQRFTRMYTDMARGPEVPATAER